MTMLRNIEDIIKEMPPEQRKRVEERAHSLSRRKGRSDHCGGHAS
jgi:hypothetical protein